MFSNIFGKWVGLRAPLLFCVGAWISNFLWGTSGWMWRRPIHDREMPDLKEVMTIQLRFNNLKDMMLLKNYQVFLYMKTMSLDDLKNTCDIQSMDQMVMTESKMAKYLFYRSELVMNMLMKLFDNNYKYNCDTTSLSFQNHIFLKHFYDPPSFFFLVQSFDSGFQTWMVWFHSFLAGAGSSYRSSFTQSPSWFQTTKQHDMIFGFTQKLSQACFQHQKKNIFFSSNQLNHRK